MRQFKGSGLLPLVLLTCLLSAACVPQAPASSLMRRPQQSARFSPATTLAAQPRGESCVLDVVLDRHPERPYVVLGLVSANWVGRGRRALETSESVLLERLQRAACEAGAHVLFGLDTATEDHFWLDGTRTRFGRSLHGSAIVGVYVTPRGRVADPPTTSRPIIRVPARLESTSPAPPAGDDTASEDVTTWEQGIADPWAVPTP